MAMAGGGVRGRGLWLVLGVSCPPCAEVVHGRLGEGGSATGLGRQPVFVPGGVEVGAAAAGFVVSGYGLGWPGFARLPLKVGCGSGCDRAGLGEGPGAAWVWSVPRRPVATQ